MSQKIILIVEGGKPNPNIVHERFRGEGWEQMRMDPTAEWAPNLIGSVHDMSAAPDQLADALMCIDRLATLPRAATAQMLNECERILKPDGELVLRLPDAGIAARHIANGWAAQPIKGQDEQRNSNKPLIYADDILYGSIDANGKPAFCQAFSLHKLSRLLNEAGFGRIHLSRKDYWIWLSAIAKPTRVEDANAPTRIFDHHPNNSPYREAQGIDRLESDPMQWNAPKLGLKVKEIA